MGLLNKKISTKAPVRYRPTTKDELYDNIRVVLTEGINNLNCIDVSGIEDMSHLFETIDFDIISIDISEWDVSNVKNMSFMFMDCKNFNADISRWDVSKVTDMRFMFYRCTNFDVDLSCWNVNELAKMKNMFEFCKKISIPNWYINR